MGFCDSESRRASREGENVISAESRRAIKALCAGIENNAVEDFFSGMDADYFETFSNEDVSKHIRMSCQLSREHPVRIEIQRRSSGEFEVVIVGYDYLAQFSIFCGLLSS